jgi:hypothetical protein
MSKRIGFLHAHHSNIADVETELRDVGIQSVHFVDPGLLHRVTVDSAFSEEAARQRVRDQLQWICACDVEAVVITCTNYAALLDGQRIPVPVIPIDQPFFAEICSETRDQVLLFTNPATVDGTMRRLLQYASTVGASPRVEALVVKDAFHLVMKGNLSEYQSRVAQALRDAIPLVSGRVSVAQLSMVTAARQIEEELGCTVGHPLTALSSHLRRSFGHSLP